MRCKTIFRFSALGSLWKTAFDNPNSYFGSCNLATNGNKSFAKAWVDKFGGTAWAFYGKSTYKDIDKGLHPAISLSRKQHGFSYYGSANYPIAASDVINNITSHIVEVK